MKQELKELLDHGAYVAIHRRKITFKGCFGCKRPAISTCSRPGCLLTAVARSLKLVSWLLLALAPSLSKFGPNC